MRGGPRGTALRRGGRGTGQVLVTGVVVGFTMPLLLYSSLVVIGRGDIYSTGTWKMGWIHFRLCFYVAYQVHTHKSTSALESTPAD